MISLQICRLCFDHLDHHFDHLDHHFDHLDHHFDLVLDLDFDFVLDILVQVELDPSRGK